MEIGAPGEESLVQLAGTTIHETAHVLAGHEAGHGRQWKAACRALGLVHAESTGQSYTPEHFAAELWAAVSGLPVPTDGRPVFSAGPGLGVGLPLTRPRRCPLGVGTRGGRSRGTGSGSRLRLYVSRVQAGLAGWRHQQGSRCRRRLTHDVRPLRGLLRAGRGQGREAAGRLRGGHGRCRTSAKMLDLSTAHLTDEMRSELALCDPAAGAPSFGGTVGLYPTEYGALMWVPDDLDLSAGETDATIPPVILAIQRFARWHGCDYVLFDADAEIEPALKTFE